MRNPRPLTLANPRRPSRAMGVVIALAVAASVAVAGCSGGSDGSAKGSLPDVKLVELNTGKATSWDGKGRPMVVNLWASWCVPCRTEMPAFDEVHQALGDKVAIVGVTDDPDRSAAKKAAAASKVSYPLKVDVDQELMVDLDVSGLPATIFVDADGTIVGRHTGALTKAELLREIEKRYDITP